MGSSRRLPTSYNIKTYGADGSGCDYTPSNGGLGQWEADTDTDLVTAQKGEVLLLTANPTITARVELAGATTSADYFRVIASVGTRKTITLSGVTSNGMEISEDYSKFYDFNVTGTINLASGLRSGISCNGTQAAVVGCIAYDISNIGSGGTSSGIGLSGVSKVNFVINCIAYNCGTNGFYLYNSSGTDSRYCLNCTSAGNVNNFHANSVSAATHYFVNCISDTATTNDFLQAGSATLSQTTNTTDDVTFVGSGNYHITNDADAVGQGTDLTSYAAYGFSDDIDFGERGSTWDIGADEYGASGPGLSYIISGTVKTKDTDASGSAEAVLVVNRTTGAVVLNTTASAAGAYTAYPANTEEHDVILIDPDGTYKPVCIAERVVPGALAVRTA